MRTEITMKVDRLELIETVRRNRDQHRAVFDAAIIGYREKAIKQLDQLIWRLKQGTLPELFVRLPTPEDHTKDYDNVISMLEAGVDDVIEIGYLDYCRFALDQWDWKVAWEGTTSMYTEH